MAINEGNGFEIDGVEINENTKTFIIAEIGNNHNGSLDSAKRLIDLGKNLEQIVLNSK
ncbi:MAG: hypothetical protein CM15mP29_3710 [Alphaproteobacteria bacterium]|nr:MAG: hypothetical protein CM15mP29_3710 [Alphaproteobacteria bacterium]